jgi:hypothetical protein
MNCQSCNNEIDYRFLSNCEQCGGAVEPAGVSQLAPITNQPRAKRATWVRRLANLIYLLASSIAGMVSGAVALYFCFALLCMTVLNHIDFGEDPSTSCARGTFITFMTILAGAFLGTIGGTVFAVKRPLCKIEIH